MSNSSVKFNLGKNFINALITFSIVALGYIFIMPWNIWISSMIRLSKLKS